MIEALQLRCIKSHESVARILHSGCACLGHFGAAAGPPEPSSHAAVDVCGRPSTPRRHKLPQQLSEFKLVCKDAGKPLALLALLMQLGGRPTIVFAASVQTTHRQARIPRRIRPCTTPPRQFLHLVDNECRFSKRATYKQLSSRSPAELCACRLHTFLQATAALQGQCLEVSSLVPPAVRTANLAAFAAGAATVGLTPLPSSLSYTLRFFHAYSGSCVYAHQQLSTGHWGSCQLKGAHSALRHRPGGG